MGTCHGIIGCGLIKFNPIMIEIQSQPNRHSGIMYITDGGLIGNSCLYYTSLNVCSRHGSPLTNLLNRVEEPIPDQDPIMNL
jgi:hypothetical protein